METHGKSVTLHGEHNNNRMERLNGEIRDREKVMRGLKKMDTPNHRRLQDLS